jgi:sister chromatid cohesion protein DCC1
MKGTPTDEAVICTPTQTFTLRTITVSNSMLFLRPDDTTHDLYIQDTCHEVLELTPSVPRLGRVDKLLRETSWEGMRGTKRAREGEVGGKRKRYTRGQLQSVIQASDAELDDGFHTRNVIQVDGMPPSPSHTHPPH